MRESPPPVFVVGASRSGTTMLRLLLNAHPRVAVPNELHYFSSIPESWLSSWKDVPVSLSEYRLFIRERLFRRDILGEFGVDTNALLNRIIEAAGRGNLSMPYRLMLEAYAEAEGKPRWGEKTPTNFFYCDILYEMFSDAKFIHLVRDPRAVVRSANSFPQLPDDTVANATNWRHYIENGYNILAECVPPSNRCTIRYEDLTSAPEESVRRICRFIEEPFDGSMLEFYRDATSYMPPSIEELGGDEKVTRPIYSDKQKKWCTELTEHEIGVVESICREQMRRFDYDTTEAQMQWASSAAYLLKRGYSALKRWQHREERFHIIRYPPPPTAT